MTDPAMQRLRHLDFVKRLGQKIVHARFQALSANIGQGMGGKRDDGDTLHLPAATRHAFFALADALGRPEPVQFRHLAIHQNQIEFLLRNQTGGNDPIGRGDDAATHILQDSGRDILVHRIVLRDQNAGIKTRSLPPRIVADIKGRGAAGFRARHGSGKAVEQLGRPYRLGEDRHGANRFQTCVGQKAINADQENDFRRAFFRAHPAGQRDTRFSEPLGVKNGDIETLTAGRGAFPCVLRLCRRRNKTESRPHRR